MPLLRGWWKEIINAILSVLCLLAIILTLFKIDGILLSSWTASVVSYLGCLVVVVALTLDPFTQQILRYQSLSTTIPHQNSSISHSLVFDKGNYATSVTSLYDVTSTYSTALLYFQLGEAYITAGAFRDHDIVNYCVCTLPSSTELNVNATYSVHSGLWEPTVSKYFSEDNNTS